ncbi:FeoB-associated Cys-rich membrane protein [Neisseria wadsworthii]|uniref:FeoB-associated Cys-rich membrane protein n=1 Tax=Neisseria wadsworthii 9715 TaxID=1030841 RepID=G4CS31_9NEIS|nr:FeoB-associated Cys-rich membrane protein [Neisseria wadsworthii]EGZ44945.1 hypothetical protein HMPREF9370_1891 [Neisseria wadsworthii 9715]QMT35547.1 FeoB-associated Cys-rich membrane protein [Neisseria wadsworthii]
MEQYIIVGLIVIVCAAYLMRKYVFKSKSDKAGVCGGCDRCGGKSGGCH